MSWLQDLLDQAKEQVYEWAGGAGEAAGEYVPDMEFPTVPTFQVPELPDIFAPLRGIFDPLVDLVKSLTGPALILSLLLLFLVAPPLGVVGGVVVFVLWQQGLVLGGL